MQYMQYMQFLCWPEVTKNKLLLTQNVFLMKVSFMLMPNYCN